MAYDYSNDMQAERLFACLAEQVKQPFLQVSQAAELIADGSLRLDIGHNTIREVSQSAIQLIDGFLLHLKLQRESQLQLESVSVSSILYDTAELLDPYAKLHGVDIQLTVGGKYGPVMAHAQGLRAALANIGYSMIDGGEKRGKRVLTLNTHKNTRGISVGVYAGSVNVTPSLLKQARKLYGGVHQPLSGFSSSNAAGVFVADELFTSLGTTLRSSRLCGESGLAATFIPSRQLSLV